MAGSSTLSVASAPDAAEHGFPATGSLEWISILSVSLLAAAVLGTFFQLFWFYRACIRNIDFDGMDYVGIARHVAEGNFYASINAFRSPLISWLIAALSQPAQQFVLAGKLLTFTSFIAAEVLLYFFTRRLWRSRLPAALAVLWFSLGRGVLPLALLFVSPDYLFTALTLAYFIVLEGCLRIPHRRTWFYLGCVHGLAYLAKAFALPWLALTTVAALLLSRNSQARQKLSYFGLAAAVPVIVVVGWGSVLHSKYGVFTSGSQFKTNIMQWTLHRQLSSHNKGYEFLVDTSESSDAYMVTDPMPPHSPVWAFRLIPGQLIPQIVRMELRNLPRALKEITVVLTPGGCLLLLVGLFTIRRWDERDQTQSVMLVIVGFSFLTLVGAYCMMVFDGRYALPILPLLMAISSGLLLSERSPLARNVRLLCGTLVAAGLLFTFFYKASPFRTLTRDFQSSCLDAGNKLRAYPQARVVTIGQGPFPEHGIGWEAGYKAAFFGGARVVASASGLTEGSLGKLEADIPKTGADALMLWGTSGNASYRRLITDLAAQYPSGRWQPIQDPERGQVGSILFHPLMRQPAR